MTKTTAATRSLLLCAMFAALTAVCSQIQIPLPFIPISLSLFAVHLSGALLGSKQGALSMACYLLLGLVGVPVFAGFTGGVGILFGPSGGYIFGYVASAFLTGMILKKTGYRFGSLCLAMAVGTAVCYLVGTLWFMAMTKTGLLASLSYCVFPFLAGDAVKILLAALLSLKLQKPFQANGWLA